MPRMPRPLPAAMGLLIAGAAVTAAPLAASAASSSAASAHTPGRDRAAVQRALEHAVAEHGLPGILALVRDHQGTWFGTAGVADTQTGRKRQPADQFRIGSAAKTFTATVMLQLVAEGKVHLDDTVDQHLPGVVSGHGHDGRRITVRHLLNQTSGISDYFMDPEMLSRYVGPGFLEHRFDRYTPEQLVQAAMAHPPYFEPGARWAYSNTNYILAGMIIERVTGRTYTEELTDRITRPLGLTGTYLPGPEETTLRGPHGRHYSKLQVPDPDAPTYDVTEMNASLGFAAGGIVSTAEDLTRFFSALLGGKLLPPAQQQEMLTTVPTTDWVPNASYGLGVSSVRLSCGVTVWGNGGAIHGSWSLIHGTRDGDRVIVTNLNGDWVDDPTGVQLDVIEAEFCPDGS